MALSLFKRFNEPSSPDTSCSDYVRLLPSSTCLSIQPSTAKSLNSLLSSIVSSSVPSLHHLLLPVHTCSKIPRPPHLAAWTDLSISCLVGSHISQLHDICRDNLPLIDALLLQKKSPVPEFDVTSLPSCSDLLHVLCYVLTAVVYHYLPAIPNLCAPTASVANNSNEPCSASPAISREAVESKQQELQSDLRSVVQDILETLNLVASIPSPLQLYYNKHRCNDELIAEAQRPQDGGGLANQCETSVTTDDSQQWRSVARLQRQVSVDHRKRFGKGEVRRTEKLEVEKSDKAEMDNEAEKIAWERLEGIVGSIVEYTNGCRVVLDVLEVDDMYIRYDGMQLLQKVYLHKANRKKVDDSILCNPLSLGNVMQTLEHCQVDFVKNECLSLLVVITETNIEIQKIVTFQGCVEILLNILRGTSEEGGVGLTESLERCGGGDSGLSAVCRSCLDCLRNLSTNAYCRKYIRQVGEVRRIVDLFRGVIIVPEETTTEQARDETSKFDSEQAGGKMESVRLLVDITVPFLLLPSTIGTIANTESAGESREHSDDIKAVSESRLVMIQCGLVDVLCQQISLAAIGGFGTEERSNSIGIQADTEKSGTIQGLGVCQTTVQQGTAGRCHRDSLGVYIGLTELLATIVCGQKEGVDALLRDAEKSLSKGGQLGGSWQVVCGMHHLIRALLHRKTATRLRVVLDSVLSLLIQSHSRLQEWLFSTFTADPSAPSYGAASSPSPAAPSGSRGVKFRSNLCGKDALARSLGGGPAEDVLSPADYTVLLVLDVAEEAAMVSDGEHMDMIKIQEDVTTGAEEREGKNERLGVSWRGSEGDEAADWNKKERRGREEQWGERCVQVWHIMRIVGATVSGSSVIQEKGVEVELRAFKKWRSNDITVDGSDSLLSLCLCLVASLVDIVQKGHVHIGIADSVDGDNMIVHSGWSCLVGVLQVLVWWLHSSPKAAHSLIDRPSYIPMFLELCQARGRVSHGDMRVHVKGLSALALGVIVEALNQEGADEAQRRSQAGESRMGAVGLMSVIASKIGLSEFNKTISKITKTEFYTSSASLYHMPRPEDPAAPAMCRGNSPLFLFLPVADNLATTASTATPPAVSPVAAASVTKDAAPSACCAGASEDGWRLQAVYVIGQIPDTYFCYDSHVTYLLRVHLERLQRLMVKLYLIHQTAGSDQPVEHDATASEGLSAAAMSGGGGIAAAGVSSDVAQHYKDLIMMQDKELDELREDNRKFRKELETLHRTAVTAESCMLATKAAALQAECSALRTEVDTLVVDNSHQSYKLSVERQFYQGRVRQLTQQLESMVLAYQQLEESYQCVEEEMAKHRDCHKHSSNSVGNEVARQSS
eukprot:GHVQ01027175.1.p1 GENE.GHVQ01027175.1~~GHVQ01027175.1.p1  ORF type:complete len:1344 (+),score=205.90 GHVQ01027175.1:134-4165(+)